MVVWMEYENKRYLVTYLPTSTYIYLPTTLYIGTYTHTYTLSIMY